MTLNRFSQPHFASLQRLFLIYALIVLVGLSWVAYGRPFGNSSVNLPDNGRFSLSFIPNVGQSDAAVHYMAHGQGMGLFFADDGLAFSNAAGAGGTTTFLRWKFVGTQTAKIEGRNVLPGVVNYLTGQDSRNWQTSLSTFGVVHYEGLYPGVDVDYYGRSGQLIASFELEAGVDPAVLQCRFVGATPQLNLETGGLDLIDKKGRSIIQLKSPQVWQQIDGETIPIAALYMIDKSGTVSLDIPGYTPEYALSANLFTMTSGFSDVDIAYDVVTDENFHVYVMGITRSSYFPTTSPLQPGFGGEADVFITKFSPDGQSLLYSTYLGGGLWEEGNGIALDSAGNIIVVGYTESVDFPLANPIQAGASVRDAFVSKISADGSQLLFSTYLGGNANDVAEEIVVDQGDNLIVVGTSLSSDFPLLNPIQPASGGSSDAFISKISADNQLMFSTYLGGSNSDSGLELALDPNGDFFLTGYSNSSDFPVASTSIPQPPTNPINGNAYATKISGDGSGILFSTLLGGTDQEFGWAIAVDDNGDAFVAGSTDSDDFPIVFPIQPEFQGGGDGFVTKIAADGSSLLYSTYLGGSGGDLVDSIATDNNGNVFLTGVTSSPDFPQYIPLPGSEYQGGSDAFVTGLVPPFGYIYSTFLGGNELDNGHGVTVDDYNRVVVVGSTNSDDFPTVNAFQPNYFREIDAFVSRIESGYPGGTVLDFSTYLGGPYPAPTDVTVSGFKEEYDLTRVHYTLGLGLLGLIVVGAWIVYGRRGKKTL